MNVNGINGYSACGIYNSLNKNNMNNVAFGKRSKENKNLSKEEQNEKRKERLNDIELSLRILGPVLTATALGILIATTPVADRKASAALASISTSNIINSGYIGTEAIKNYSNSCDIKKAQESLKITQEELEKLKKELADMKKSKEEEA